MCPVMRGLPSNTRLLLARPRRFGRRAMILMEDCGGLTWPRRRSAESLGSHPECLRSAGPLLLQPVIDRIK